MDTINYLYARLNIIDSKASSILAVNTLALGITSLVVTTAGGGRSGSGPVRVHGIVLVLALVMVGCGLVAIFLSLAITRLKFDHMIHTHPIDDYEAQFMNITIARQRILAVARLFTGLAFLLYAALLIAELLGFR